MVTTFQKIPLITGLMMSFFIITSASAQALSVCSAGDLMVGQKKVGIASYAAQNCSASWQNQTMQIDFSYHYNIPEWAFKRAATHFLKQNIQHYNEKSVFNQITKLYRPVKKGDVYRLHYVHATRSLTLLLNGQMLGKIQDPQAQQYFRIWLGPKPFSVKLKQQLLNES